MARKRAFVRALWGIHDHEGRRFYKRRLKMDDDIELLQHSKYEPPFVSYTFGFENHEFLRSRGITSVLVDERPIVWDLDTQFYRHKLEAFDQAMKDFDDVVFLDWDSVVVEPIPRGFWEALSRKAPMQAILHSYRTRRVFWREEDTTIVPSAAFVYLRGREASQGIIRAWEELQDVRAKMSAEPAMGKYADDLSGGWKGIDHYWDHFEPSFFTLRRGKVFPKAKLRQKRVCVRHFSHSEVLRELDSIQRGVLKSWQQ